MTEELVPYFLENPTHKDLIRAIEELWPCRSLWLEDQLSQISSSMLESLLARLSTTSSPE